MKRYLILICLLFLSWQGMSSSEEVPKNKASSFGVRFQAEQINEPHHIYNVVRRGDTVSEILEVLWKTAFDQKATNRDVAGRAIGLIAAGDLRMDIPDLQITLEQHNCLVDIFLIEKYLACKATAEERVWAATLIAQRNTPHVVEFAKIHQIGSIPAKK